MDFAAKVVGIVLICMGLLLLLRPGAARTLTGFFVKDSRLYISGGVRLAVAVLFLLAATKCAHPWIIGIFGVVFLLGGMVIFLAGPAKLRPMLTWLMARSLVWSRIIGIIVMALGGIIVYAA
jgi:uncharacterized protein YjeT (DUF2065 family)